MNGDATVWFLAGIGVGLACAILAFAAIAALDRRALRGARGRPQAAAALPEAAHVPAPQPVATAPAAAPPALVRPRESRDAEDEIFAALAKARQASDSEPREPSVVIDFPEPGRTAATAPVAPAAEQRSEPSRIADRPRIAEARTAPVPAPALPDAPAATPRRSFERPPAAAASPATAPAAPAASGMSGSNGAGPSMPPARSRPLVPPPAANTQSITPPAAAAPAATGAASTAPAPGSSPAPAPGHSAPAAQTSVSRPAAPRPQIAPLPPPSAAPRRRFTEILVPADSIPLPENATEAPPTTRPIPASRPKIGASTPTPPPATLSPPAPSRPAFRAKPPATPAPPVTTTTAGPISAPVGAPAAAPIPAAPAASAASAPVVPETPVLPAKSGTGTPTLAPATDVSTRSTDDNSVEALFAEAFGLQRGDGDGPLPEGPAGK